MAVVGPRGWGKTLYVVQRIVDHLTAGGRVVTNVSVEGSYSGELIKADHWGAVWEAQSALVVIDEAHLWAPSWDWKALNSVDRFSLTNGRKSETETILVTHHVERLAATLRALLTEVAVCNRPRGRMFSAKVFQVEDAYKARARALRSLYWYRSDGLSAAYDTAEVVPYAAGIDERERVMVEALVARDRAGVPRAGVVDEVAAGFGLSGVDFVRALHSSSRRRLS